MISKKEEADDSLQNCMAPFTNIYGSCADLSKCAESILLFTGKLWMTRWLKKAACHGCQQDHNNITNNSYVHAFLKLYIPPP